MSKHLKSIAGTGLSIQLLLAVTHREALRRASISLEDMDLQESDLLCLYKAMEGRKRKWKRRKIWNDFPESMQRRIFQQHQDLERINCDGLDPDTYDVWIAKQINIFGSWFEVRP
jgi:hypothetical protein